MVYKSSLEAGYGIGVSADKGMSTDHVDASHADRIDIPDAALLFRGHFAHAGPDLVLTGEDGHRLVITGYFATEKHPDLIAPNGAHLTGELVDLLAGSPTPGHYAQAKTTLPPEAIGKVEKVVGQVTLIHNGVSGPLHVGDPVFKTDVVQTGTNSSCGIAFPDGTALDLVNNTRMALNEYNFEANSAANGAVFSLVEGTFAFVAGQVAHTGEGMKINTPIATMGIRGTVGLFRSEPTVINSNLGHIWSAFLHEDIDGSHHLGRIAFIDTDPTSPTFGQEFYLLDSSDYIAYFEPQGAGLPPHVRLEPVSNSKVFDDRHFYDDLGHILNAYQTGQVSPGSTPGSPGSGDDPNSILTAPDLLQELGGKPLFDFAPGVPGSGGSFVPFIPIIGNILPPIQVDQGQNPNSNGPTSTVFIWNGTGDWPATSPWNQGSAPNLPIDQVIIQSGTATYNIGANTILAFLTVDPGATLDIVAGRLTAGGLLDNGSIIVDGDPPIFVINGPATIGAGHLLQVAGPGSEAVFTSSMDNHGVVAAQLLGTVVFSSELVTNEHGAIIAAVDGSVDIENTIVHNAGIIGAGSFGVVTIENSVVNNSGGIIGTAAVPDGDFGGSIVLSNATIVGGVLINAGGGDIFVYAAAGSNMSVFDGSTSALTVAGVVTVLEGAQLALKGAIHIDGGEIAVGDGGTQAATLVVNGNVTLETDAASDGAIALNNGHIIGAGPAATLENVNAIIAGSGEIGGGSLKLTNDASGVVNANVATAALILDATLIVSNAGILQASHGGTLDLRADVSNSGVIQAEDGTVLLSGTIENSSTGIIAAGTNIAAAQSDGDGGASAVAAATAALIMSLEDLPPPPNSGDSGSVFTINPGGGEDFTSLVNLDNATIVGGTLETGWGGFIQTVNGNSTFDGVTIADGSQIQVSNDTSLTLKHTIDNEGTITLCGQPIGDSINNGDPGGANLVIDGAVTLKGHGDIVLSEREGFPNQDDIVAGQHGGTLDNVDNTIEGAGTIGSGDPHFAVTNEVGGTIDADVSGGVLTIDTADASGHSSTLLNAGLLEATNNGELSVQSTVDNTGGTVNANGGFVDFLLSISNGQATISNGGTLEYGWSSNVATAFDGAGTLVLDHQVMTDANFAIASYTGTVTGFGAHDEIVLTDLNFSANETALWSNNLLSIYDGETLEATINLNGNYNGKSFIVVNDNGHAEVELGTAPPPPTEEEWKPAASGSWHDDSQWTLGSPPTSDIDAFVDLPGNYTITIQPSDNATAKTLTITDKDAVITGSGTLTVGSLENHGTIQATGEQDLVVEETGTGTTNFGKFLALDGGTLTVDHAGSAILEAGGVTKAEGSGSTLTLNNNESVANDGTVVAADGGKVVVDVVTDGPGIGGDNVLGGNFNVMKAVSGGTLDVIGDMLNAQGATIKADGVGSTVTFSAADYADHTATGIDNEGDILANHHGIVSIADVGIDNDGTIGARHHGTVEISFSLIDNDGGTIAAHGHGSAVELFNVDIAGGTLKTGDLTDGKHGVIDIVAPGEEASNFVEFDGATDGPLHVDAFVRVEAGANLVLTGSIDNKGTIDLADPEISGGHLIIYETVHLHGSGAVTLDGGNAEIVGANDDEGNTLYNESTIVGAGSIGGGDLKLLNECSGVIDATGGDDGRLVIDTGDLTVVNKGLMEATGAGTLQIESDVNNKHGTIGAFGANAVTKLFGVTITGGRIETGDPYWRDNGVIEIAAAGLAALTIFDGSQHHNPVTIAGFVQVDPNADLELKGHIDLAGGTIYVGQTGSPGADLVIAGDVKLTGPGAVALTGPDADIVGAGEDASTLHNDATIVGAGNIGSGDGSLIFVNHGLVNSDGAGAGPIVIDTGWHAVTNTGTLEATAGGELDLYGTYQNSGGQIVASAEGDTPPEAPPTVVKLFDATIEGGSLVTDDMLSRDGGFIEIVAMHDDDNVTTFDGSHDHAVTIDGYVLVDAGANLALEGTIHNHGTIEVDGKQTDLVIDGSVTLDGHGTILLDNASHPADQIVGGDEDSNTLYNVDNTIEGAGNIGTGNQNLSLVNESHGTIEANDQGQKLTIDTGHHDVINNGLMESTGGGILEIKSDVDNHGGTITVGDGSAVELAASVFGGTINDTGSDFSAAQGLFVEGNHTLDCGTLYIGNSDSISLLWNQDLTGNGATLTLGSHLTIDQTGAAGIFSTFASTDIHDGVVSYATINTSEATFTIQPDYFTNYGQINADGGGTIDIIPTSWFKNYGTVAISNGESATIGDGFVDSQGGQPGGVTNETGGQITVGEDSSLSIGNGSPFAEKAGIFVNDGTLAVNGGTAEIFGAVHGSGTDTVSDGGTLKFDAYVSAHQTVSFGDPGTVVFSDSADFHAGISNFAAGDIIDAADIQYATGEYAAWMQTSGTGGTLELFSAQGVLEDTLNLNGVYSQPQFALADDGSSGHGTDISFVPPVTAHWVGAQTVPGDDWTKAGDWVDDNGHVLATPNLGNDAVIDEGGAYTLTITTAATANSLTITALGADVQDETGGSLTLTHALTIEGGSFSLNGGSLSAASIEVDSNGHFIGGGTVSAPIDNEGFVEAGHGGVGANLALLGDATGNGTYQIDSGGTLEFGKSVAAGATVQFADTIGLLKIDDAADFHAQIDGFTGTEDNAQHSDEVELTNFDPQKLKDTATYNSTTGITALTIFDGKNASLTDTLYFVGDYTDNNTTNEFSVHEKGGNVVVFDPPAADASAPSVSIGGAGNDTFVFHPGEGAQTLTNFSAQQDTIELDHFGNVQNLQELAAAITPDAHGNAVLELGHGDSIAIPGVSATYLQQHVQSLVHLH